MRERFTLTQKQRLAEWNASDHVMQQTFCDKEERDLSYKDLERKLISENKEQLKDMLENRHFSTLSRVERNLSDWLADEMGFTMVLTPIMITDQMLTKMSIDETHPLRKQVFQVDQNRYLRPMLAPNLYEMMRDIHLMSKGPVRIFEVGPCFRKESQGVHHLNEFTMLNLVEFDCVKEGDQMSRLIILAEGAMKALSINGYSLVPAYSEVYGDTLDVMYGDLELASGAFGPHSLDSRWGIFDKTWVGIGFGLERLAMLKGGHKGIRKVGRSISYFDGIRLNGSGGLHGSYRKNP